MRKVRETRRGMLPEAMRLDAIVPVSSLVFGLPAIAAAASPTATPEERREVPARRHSRAETDHPTFKRARPSRTFADQSRSAKSLSSLYVANVAQTRLNAAVASHTFFASLKPSPIDAANPLPSHGPEATPSGLQPRSSGASPAAPSPSAPPAPSPAPAPAVTPDSDGIRPMTIAPIVSGSRPIPTPSYDTDIPDHCTAVYPSTCGCGEGSTSGSTSGSSGGGSGSGSDTGDPSLYFTGGGPTQKLDGTYVDTIGDKVMAAVEAGYGSTLVSVAWDIDGAYQSQNYTEDTGFTNTPLPSPNVQSIENGSFAVGAMYAYMPFYWNAEPERVRPIKATITQKNAFGNLVVKEKTLYVKVQPPVVQEFKLNFRSNQFVVTDAFEPVGQNQIGFTQAVRQMVGNPPQISAIPGDYFTAIVDTPADPDNKPSNFAVLQVAVGMHNEVTLASGAKKSATIENKIQLDKVKPFTSPYLNDRVMGPFAAGQNGILIPKDTFGDERVLDDSPALITPTLAYITDGADYVVAINESIDFRTYLVYNAYVTGKYVAVSQIDWSVSGTATLIPENSPDGLRHLVYYENTANWQIQNVAPIVLLPATIGTKIGVNQYVEPNWQV